VAIPVLIVLQPDAVARARVVEALRDRFEIVEVDDWAQLLATAPAQAPQACVVDPYPPSGGAARLAEIERLRSALPLLPVVAYGAFRPDEDDVFRMGRLGLDGVLVRDHNDGREQIRRALDRALSLGVATRVERVLEGRLPEPVVRAVVAAIEGAAEGISADGLAAAVGMPRRRLARLVYRTGRQSLRHLLTWGRIFHGIRLLSRGGATVDAVALIVGYASGNTFRRAVKTRVGFPPTAVLRRGGDSCVLEAFLREWRLHGRPLLTRGGGT